MTTDANSNVTESLCEVLIIDDEESLRDILKEGLEIMDRYRVSTAADAESGLAHIQTRVPDVLLLDIALPGMDGFELLRHLGPFGNVTRPRTVVAMSALTNRETNQKLSDPGVTSVLPKPFTLNELLKVVST